MKYYINDIEYTQAQFQEKAQVLDLRALVTNENEFRCETYIKVYNDEEKREMRKPILQAFDTYKTNIAYGTITETEEEHLSIISWYKNLLDLDIDAIKNVPEKVKIYL